MSFADGHTDYWKWIGVDTIEHARLIENQGAGYGWKPTTEEGFRDLYKMQRGCWGKLGYTANHSG